MIVYHGKVGIDGKYNRGALAALEIELNSGQSHASD